MENVVCSFLLSAKKVCKEGSGMNVAGANPLYLAQKAGGVVRLVVSDDAEMTSAMKTEKHFLNAVITGYPNKS